MCDPVSASFVMAGANLMQGVAGYQAGSAENKMAKNQARLLDQSAGQTQQQGLRDEEQLRTQVRQFLGQQAAAIGASGVENSGSVARLQEDAARQGELDALTVRNNAYLEAWGLKEQAKSTRYQGKLAKRQGQMTLLTSALNAGAFAAQGMAGMPKTSTASATVQGPSGPIKNTARMTY